MCTCRTSSNNLVHLCTCIPYANNDDSDQSACQQVSPELSMFAYMGLASWQKESIISSNIPFKLGTAHKWERNYSTLGDIYWKCTVFITQARTWSFTSYKLIDCRSVQTVKHLAPMDSCSNTFKVSHGHATFIHSSEKARCDFSIASRGSVPVFMNLQVGVVRTPCYLLNPPMTLHYPKLKGLVMHHIQYVHQRRVQ